MNTARSGARIVAAVALASTAFVSAQPATFAQSTDDTSTDDVELVLVSQPPTATLGATTTFSLGVPPASGPDDDRTLRLRLYNRLSTLDAFLESAAGEPLRGRLDNDAFAVADLPRASDGSVAVTIGVGNDAPLPALAAARAGVYPLEVSLEAARETFASFVTWVVVVDPSDPIERPLSLAWVWSLVTSPVLGVDGAVPATAPADLAPGGRLDAIASLLAETGDLPLTLQLGPETFESWEALAQQDPAIALAVERVRTAATRPTTRLLPAPYVPVDLTALEAAGLGDELPEQIVTGSDTVERLTGARPDARIAYAEPVDGPVLARLRQLLVDRVVVRDTQVDVEDRPLLEPFVVTAGPGEVRAAASTSLVDDLLNSSGEPARRVHRALSALSVLAFADPDAPRGIVVATPLRWQPEVELYAALATALLDHPLVQPVTIDDYFEAFDGELAARDLVPDEPVGFPVTGSAYAAAKRALAALRATIPADSPVLAQGERALLLALSTEQSPATAEAQLAVVHSAVQQLTAGVGTTNKRVTVTSRRAAIPLSFRNDTGHPVRVRVRLESTKLLFPEGDETTVELPPGNHTERFVVEARTSGTFTMTVSLTTGDGAIAIGAPTRVTVRSAVFSGVGAALTAGALLFLALWWGNHFRRTRRARAAAPPT